MTLRRRIVAAVAAALCALAPGAALAASPPPLHAHPERLTLRLSDLGPGYVMGDGPGIPAELPGFGRLGPLGSRASFERAWTVPGVEPGPAIVESQAFVFPDVGKARAALARPRALAAAALDFSPAALAVVPGAPTVGDAAVLLRSGAVETILTWRSGATIGLVAITDRSEAKTAAAARLALAQQARIAEPTPLRPSEFDDLEVRLDDPHLGFTVRWLGRRLAAHGRWPALVLSEAQGRNTLSEASSTLIYNGSGTARRPSTDLVLTLWKPAKLRRLLHSPAIRRSCLRPRPAGLPGVDATIYGSPRSPRPPCRGKQPKEWVAVASYADVAVLIETLTLCQRCDRSPYDSPAGMRVLLRALRPRTPRAFPPAPGAG